MSKERIAMLVRTAVLFIALLNQLLLVFGYSILPVTEQEFEQLFSALLTVGASLWTWLSSQT